MKILFHRGGPEPCLGPAISVRKLPSRYEIAADNVLKLDGTQPQRGEGMFCGTCKKPITPQWLFQSLDAERLTA